MELIFPRYASPKRPGLLIPPSPPAERREAERRDWKAFLRDHMTYSGAICLPGELGGRVIRPSRHKFPEMEDLARWFAGRNPLASMFPGRIRGSVGPSFPSGAVAHWRFEEASGTRVDATGRGNDLSTVTNNPGNQAAKINNGVAFVRASAQRLSRAATSDTHQTGAFTIASWYYQVTAPNSYGSVSYMIAVNGSAGNYPTGDFSFFLDHGRAGGGASPEVRLWIENQARVGKSVTINNPTMPTATWFLIIAWFDPSVGSGTLGVSVNDGAVGSNTSTSAGTGTYASLGSPGTFQVGADSTVGQYMDGALDSMTIWGRALTAQERTDLYNGGSGLDYS